ncbi:MAG: hypothetical protein V1838_02925 [Patescibacteria group bacterium]
MDLFLDIAKTFSLLGLGAFIGIIIKHFLDKSRNNQAMLFEARRRAYKDVIGRINNFFQEDDARGLNRLERKIRMNSFFSEAELLGSDRLRQAIHEYINKVDSLDDKIEQAIADEDELARLDEELGNLIQNIESIMRQELGVK